jgi:hypothetical protein
LHFAGFDPDAGSHAEQGEKDHGKSPNADATEHALQGRAGSSVIRPLLRTKRTTSQFGSR